MNYEESELLYLLNKQDIDMLFLKSNSYLCQTKSLFEEKEQLQQENEQLKDNINQMDDSVDKLQKQLIKEKANWNKLKEYLINDINNRNGNRVVEYEDSKKVRETISPNYTLIEDKSRTMKEILNKMQELEKGKN